MRVADASNYRVEIVHFMQSFATIQSYKYKDKALKIIEKAERNA